MDDFERAILTTIAAAPHEISKTGIVKADFSTPHGRAIFEGIAELSHRGNGPIDPFMLQNKTKVPIDVIKEIVSNSDKIPTSNISWHIQKMRRARLGEKLFTEIKKQGAKAIKSGNIDVEKTLEIIEKIQALETTEGLDFKKLSEIQPMALDWLWFNRVPLGSYSAVCGDPGDGKSLLMTYIGAKITQGEPLPDKQLENPVGSVLYFVAEDGLGDTVRIRAEDAGADLEKFEVHTGEKTNGRFFSLVNSEDRQALEEKIKKLGDVKLIIFDPISTFMAGLRSNDENEVRAALAPLNRLAEKYKLAIVGISHLNKDAAKRALYRLAGSIAFVAVARTVWLVKKDEDSETRYFAPLKFNLLKNPTTLSFRIFGSIGNPKIDFDAMPVDITSEELLADEDQRERLSAIAEAKAFLSDQLPKSGSKKLQREIEKAAKAESIAKRTLTRAKKQLGIKSEQHDRQWYWKRP
jgi:hypothetical protein